MDRGPLQKAILLYLTWLGVIGGALIVMLGDLLPLSLSFVRADSLFTCFLQSQIFFVVFLWPLFLPVLIRGSESGTGLLVQVVVLMVFALPLSLLCANISDVSWGRLISGHALVVALAVFVGGLFILAGARGWRTGPWYYLGAFILSAGLPYLGFLSHQVIEVDLSYFAAISPFWGALDVGGGRTLAQSIVFGVLAAGLFSAATLLRKEVDALSPAR